MVEISEAIDSKDEATLESQDDHEEKSQDDQKEESQDDQKEEIQDDHKESQDDHKEESQDDHKEESHNDDQHLTEELAALQIEKSETEEQWLNFVCSELLFKFYLSCDKCDLMS